MMTNKAIDKAIKWLMTAENGESLNNDDKRIVCDCEEERLFLLMTSVDNNVYRFRGVTDKADVAIRFLVNGNTKGAF